MTERRMMVTIGYDTYIGVPRDIATLIEISERMTRVDHSADYRSMRLHEKQEEFVRGVGFVQMDYSLVAPQPNAAEPNAADPAPVPAAPAGFRMTNETASWEDWLAQANSLPGGNGVSDADLAKYFAEGKTPAEAVDDAVPF